MRLRGYLLLVGSSLLWAACATSPGVSAQSSQAPSWILQRDFEENGAYAFVVEGRAPDKAAAREAAGVELNKRITSFLGLDLSLNSTAQARAAIDSFQQEVLQTVSSSGSGHLAGLRIAQEFAYQEGGVWSVYLKGMVDKKLFDLEAQRLNDLWYGPDLVVSKGEAAGDQAVGSGGLYQGLDQYLAAARACWNPGVNQPEFKFDRLMGKALTQVNRIRLVPALKEWTAVSDGTSPGPISARAVMGAGADQAAIVGLPIQALVPVRDGRDVSTVAIQRKSDAEGLVSFDYPGALAAVEGNLVIGLDVKALLDPLDKVPSASKRTVSALRSAVDKLKTQVPLRILAAGKSKPLAVAATDASAQAALLGPLAEGGWTAKALSVPVSPDTADAGPAAWKQVLPAKTAPGTRLVLLTVRTVSSSPSDDMVSTRVQGTVQVWETDGVTVLLNETAGATALGADAAASAKNAARKLGSQLGQLLADVLP